MNNEQMDATIEAAAVLATARYAVEQLVERLERAGDVPALREARVALRAIDYVAGRLRGRLVLGAHEGLPFPREVL